MATIYISDEVRNEWKIYCANKKITIKDATELALKLAMKHNKIKQDK